MVELVTKSIVEGLVFENSSWIEGGEIITPQLPEQTLRTKVLSSVI